MSGRCLFVVVAAVSIAACSSARKPVSEEGSNPPSAALARCTGCHGDPANGNAAPPLSIRGGTETTDIGVGAHQQHLRPNPFRQPIDCSECHVVPATIDAPGHIDKPVADLTWGPLAAAGSVTPTYQRSADGTTATCTNYCHGASFAATNGALHTPSWTVVNGTQAGCGTCHGIPPPSPHPPAANSTACSVCHPQTINPDGTIDVGGGRHINGIIDLAGGAAGCTACHGDPSRTPADIASAPPVDTNGNLDATAPGVGAHQKHLTGGTIRLAMPCASCHVVPTDFAHATQPLNLTWSPLAQSRGVTPTFDPTALTCANYCHGLGNDPTLFGGSNTAPVWNRGASQAACGTCHGLPPPPASGHPAVGSDLAACGGCHPGTVKADGTIDTAGGKHVNGAIDVTGGSCTSCHGDPNRTPASIAAAPPAVQTICSPPACPAPAAGGGAHLAHLTAGTLSGPLGCSECHTVPTDVLHAALPLDLTWGALARTGAVTPTYDPNTLTCTNYCHGASLTGGALTTPTWTSGPTQVACGACHGLPPDTGHHLTITPGGLPSAHQGFSCVLCHGTGFSATSTNTAVHVNGTKNVGPPTVSGSSITTWVPPAPPAAGSCTPVCHGTRNW